MTKEAGGEEEDKNAIKALVHSFIGIANVMKIIFLTKTVNYQ